MRHCHSDDDDHGCDDDNNHGDKKKDGDHGDCNDGLSGIIIVMIMMIMVVMAMAMARIVIKIMLLYVIWWTPNNRFLFVKIVMAHEHASTCTTISRS